MAELDARDQGLSLNQSVAIASVIDPHLVDTQSVWHDKVCTVSRGAALLFQEDAMIGI